MATWASFLKKEAPITPPSSLNLLPCHSSAEPTKREEKKPQSGILSLHLGCIQQISRLLEYRDVFELQRTCKLLHNLIFNDDVLWEDQCSAYYFELQNLYCSNLLRTDFAGLDLHGQDGFRSLLHLYNFDTVRLWHLDDCFTLTDEFTGMFSIPLYRDDGNKMDENGCPIYGEQQVGAPLLVQSLPSKALPIRVFKPYRKTLAFPDNPEDEEAGLRYALALSALESKKFQSNPFEYAFLEAAEPVYSPGELLTMAESFYTSREFTRLQCSDQTEQENCVFLSSLSKTLTAAKQRRLHLGNHHRAVRNNGQRSRNRLGGLADSHKDPDSATLPVNKMLADFSGALLEVSAEEISNLCDSLLGEKCLSAIKDFVEVAPNTGSSASYTNRVFPKEWVRYFILPEVCKEGRIGLLVVDPVRILCLVENERENNEYIPEEHFVRHRLVQLGQGSNGNG